MKSKKSHAGQHGADWHEELVNIIRFDVLPKLWAKGYEEAACIADEQTMIYKMGLKGKGRKKNVSQRPDAMIVENKLHIGTNKEHIILIEIGNFNLCKYDTKWIVINVGENLRIHLAISLDVKRKESFEVDVIHAIEEIINEGNILYEY